METVAKEQGHDITSMIEHDEVALVANKLIGERGNQGATVPKLNGRLTNLGFTFCQNIENLRGGS